MFIINPLLGRGADNLFSTHPSTQNRVEALAAKFDGRAVSPSPELVSPRRNRPQDPWDRPQGGDRKSGPWG
jgi:heat shock protein HtpX